MDCRLLFAVALALAASVAAVDATFDFFLFEQQWGPGVCAFSSKRSSKVNLKRSKDNCQQTASGQLSRKHGHVVHECVVPANATDGFTIHGLWPSIKGRTDGPFYCNDTWPFYLHAVQPLMGDMVKFWPSLFGSSSSDFWCHEWSKHGTCAAVMPALDSEYKFFSFVLNFRKQHDFASYLAESSIVPNNQQKYQLEDMLNAIKKSIGVLPILGCETSKTEPGQYLATAAICLSNDLKIADCDQSVFQETQYQCDSAKPVIFKEQTH